MAARCAPGVLVIAVCLGGCEEPGRQQHPDSSPQLAATISNLRKAEETLTGYGHFAKRIRRNTDAETLYTEAVARHNACISYLKAGLDTGWAAEDLRGRLHGADVARTKLMDWCKNHARRRTPIRSEGGPTASGAESIVELASDLLVGVLHELLDYDLQLRKLEQEERAAQIVRIKQELTACECRQWSSL